MSDENELNSKLSDEHAAIEASLYSVSLPASSIDHDSVMYQAGWAAALAERDSRSPSVSKTNSRFWPALAMTFAATTAACLAVIVLPSVEDGMPVANNDSAAIETVVEQSNEESLVAVQNRDDEVASSLAGLRSPVATAKKQFGMARLFGARVEQMMVRRNAQFEQHLAEAVSPLRSRVVSGGADESDLEPVTPLTSGSVFSFSL